MLCWFSHPDIQQYPTMPNKCPTMLGFIGRNAALVCLCRTKGKGDGLKRPICDSTFPANNNIAINFVTWQKRSQHLPRKISLIVYLLSQRFIDILGVQATFHCALVCMHKLSSFENFCKDNNKNVLTLKA